ncbi:MAG TPA: nucleotide exchange factor GrpE [Anaerolineales bacterium]|jgi:molecular chaperone GrpE|nr:nucleotide exchange factor GrpE [Anaerolineales bacterium]
MTEKKHHKHENEEANETQASAETLPENEGQSNAELEALQAKLAEAESKATEYKDGWMRSQAEFQNYKKRLERDNEMMYVSMKGDIIKKILPVLDDLERALQNRPADTGPWVSGIELIQKKVQSILEAEGVKRIEAEGQPFDPNFHEAISHEPSETVKSGYVIGVAQNGYMLGDRVIRPALVRVAQ